MVSIDNDLCLCFISSKLNGKNYLNFTWNKVRLLILFTAAMTTSVQPSHLFSDCYSYSKCETLKLQNIEAAWVHSLALVTQSLQSTSVA